MKNSNKNIKVKVIASLMIATLVAIGCSDGKKENKLNAVFAARVADATQNFTMDNSAGGTITGEKGVIFQCAADAFLDGEGQAVSGAVDIELIEAPTYREMLALDKQTVGDDEGTLRKLKSGGQVFLNAKKNGEQLGVAANKCTLDFPTITFDSDMRVFDGIEDDEGNVVWNQTDITPTSNSIVVGEEEKSYYNYQLPPSAALQLNDSSLGWINIDQFYHATEGEVSFKILLPEGFDYSNTKVWAVFPSLNGMAQLSNFNGVPELFIEPGTEFTLVVLSIRDDETYKSSFNNINISQDTELTVEFESTTLEQFDLDVQGL